MVDDPMLAFYRAHKVSPVRQEVGDLSAHFERRASLYRGLCLLPAMVTGRSVLEIGPGSGHNALYTASLRPGRYVLLEGNDTGIQQIAAVQDRYPYFKQATTLCNQSLKEFLAVNTERFDVVLIEAVLGGFPQPHTMLPALLSLLQPGGILVLTTVDAISSLAENVRRLLAYRLIDRRASLEEQLAILSPALQPHLETLVGMSRRYDDWIIDNILLPHSAGYNFLSIADVAKALPDSYDILGTSPHITRDLRWYKSLVGENRYAKQLVAAEYWRVCHNFIDCRSEFQERTEEQNRVLYAAASSFKDRLIAYEETNAPRHVSLAADCLKELQPIIGSFAPVLSAAFDEAHGLLRKNALTVSDVANMRHFAPVFGRCLQYVSVYHEQKPELPSPPSA